MIVTSYSTPFINFFGYKKNFSGPQVQTRLQKRKISNYEMFEFFAKAKLDFSS